MPANVDQPINSLVIFKDVQAHTKTVNDILFIDEKNLFITASSDGSCKIYELSSLRLLKRLNFRTSLNDKSNLSMRSLCFNRYTNKLFTMQARGKGETYVTKWNLDSSFSPDSSVMVSNSVCTGMDLHIGSSVIGLGDCEGKVIYVDSDSMKVIKQIVVNETTVRAVVFSKSNLLSGTANNALKMNAIVKPGLISLWTVLKLLLLIVIIYAARKTN